MCDIQQARLLALCESTCYNIYDSHASFQAAGVIGGLDYIKKVTSHDSTGKVYLADQSGPCRDA